jgi:hypothetical protein
MYTIKAITINLSELQEISERLSSLINVMKGVGACLIISDENAEDNNIDIADEINNFRKFVNNFFSKEPEYLNKREFKSLYKFYADLLSALNQSDDKILDTLDKIANGDNIIILKNDNIKK